MGFKISLILLSCVLFASAVKIERQSEEVSIRNVLAQKFRGIGQLRTDLIVDIDEDDLMTLEDDADVFNNDVQDQIERDEASLLDEDERDDATGTESYEGHINFAIITSYTDGVAGSGIVWAVNADDKDQSQALISGLEKPLNSCFDKQNAFLYVCDYGTGVEGSIYQYDIEWDEDDTFELKEDKYAVIYRGNAPTDCAVDSIGNMFFSTAGNSIYGVSYNDLHAKKTNTNFVIADSTSVSGCSGIDVRDDDEILFVNGVAGDTLGSLARIELDTATTSTKTVSPLVIPELSAATGLAVTENDAYYTSNSKLYAYNFETKDVTKIAGPFTNPTSVAYGGREVWVADNGTGYVYRFDSDDEDEKADDGFVAVVGIQGVHLVNTEDETFAAFVAVLLGLLMF